MKITTKMVLCFLILGILSACQETKIVEVDIPFSEYSIIYGDLRQYEAFKGISIQKSFSLNEILKLDEAYIDDAICYLKMNDLSTIPLLAQGNGIYKPYNSIYPDHGQKYELFVDVRGKEYYAKTQVPQKPRIRKAKLVDNIITVEIVSYQGESYGALWAFVNNQDIIIDKSDDFHSFVESNGDNSIIEIQTKPISQEKLETYSRNRLRVILYSYDEDYANYFNSKSLNTSIENVLTQGGSPIYTNISGNNVAGSFTASTDTLINVQQVWNNL